MPNTGTHSLDDLLDVRFQAVSVADFGMDTIAEVLARDLAAHNAIVNELLDEFVEPTTDLQRIYGTHVDGSMVEVDEFGRSATQKDRPGATVGFPLRRFQRAVGWTDLWFKQASVRDVAVVTTDVQKSDLNKLRNELKRALFLSGNYSFVDFLDTKTTLSVKRLLNADGDPIPPGPNGETFDGATETNYTAGAGLTTGLADELIQNVVKHGHSEDVRIAINQGDEATWKALSGFKEFVDVRLTHNANANEPVRKVDTLPVDNRPVGLYNGATVWVKPWAISDYALCWAAGDPNKPLAMRERKQPVLRGLRLAGQIPMYPLFTDYFERDFGFGVWTRTNGAVLYFNGGAYVDPAI